MPSAPLKLLIIRRDNIGDLVCTTPLLSELRRLLPAAQIDVLVNSYNAPVLRGNPHVNTTHVYTKGKHRDAGQSWAGVMIARLATLWRMRRAKYDLVILATGKFDQHGLKMARWLNARRIIGVAITERQRRALDTPFAPLPYGQYHEVESLFRLAEVVVPEAAINRAAPGCVYPDASLRARMETRYAPAGRMPLVVLHLSSRLPTQRWPMTAFAALATQLKATHPDLGILVTWSPGASDAAGHPGDDDALAELMRLTPPGLLTPIPTRTLDELIAATDLASVWIGSDGGTMHLAAALGKQVVCFFENKPDNHIHWRPWTPHHRLLHSDTTVDRIPVTAVYEATQAALAGAARAGK